MPAEDCRPPAIALMGPTASGKTALALDWAQRLGGEIISVDSALVYRGLDIGSAKPDADERARAPHHLIDVREPHQPYSAADFCREARRAIDGILARGRVPLLVGGTGLYFRALCDGLSPLPEAEPALRAALVEEAQTRGWAALHAELAAIDPEAGRRIRAGDTQRIQRALEVWRLTGRPISQWQREGGLPSRLPVRLLKLALWPDRALLRLRIASRFEAMLAAGFLDEVRRLKADPRLHTDLPAIRAVGYRQAWEHLEGLIDAAEFRRRAIVATGQLAKRQLTWLRGEIDLQRFDAGAPGGPEAIERAIQAFLPT